MFQSERGKIVGTVLLCFLCGCGSSIREFRQEDTDLDLVVRTVPTGADVYVNSDYMGKSPAEVHIPCTVFIQEKSTV